MPGKHSREKGKRGERQWRDQLRDQGWCARRGQQYSGSETSADVLWDGPVPIHWEVKVGQRLRVREALEQAKGDCGEEEIPVAACRQDNDVWFVSLFAGDFFRILRGDFEAKPPA